MATPGAIGRMRLEAHERMMKAATSVASKLGVVSLDIPSQGRDPHITMARQIEAMADWLEQVDAALNPTPEVNALASIGQALALLEELALVSGPPVEPSSPTEPVSDPQGDGDAPDGQPTPPTGDGQPQGEPPAGETGNAETPNTEIQPKTESDTAPVKGRAKKATS